MGSNNTRIIISVFLFLGVFIFPWWFSCVLFTLSFIKIPNFYEGLIMALIYDIFYFVERALFWDLPIFFIFSLLIFFLSKLVWKQLRI